MDLKAIKKRIEQIENYEQENKIAKEAIKNELENSPEYLQAVNEAKAAQENKKRIREEILNSEEVQKLEADIKENNEEIEALREILSLELMEFYTKNNTYEIEDNFGQVRKFKIIAKILPKKRSEQDRDYSGRYSQDGEKIDAEAVNPPLEVVDEPSGEQI